MRALILFGIVFFSGTCCILADSEEKKVHWTEITKDPFASIADRNSFNNGADDKFIHKDAYYNISEQLLIRNRTRWQNKNTKVDWSSGAYIPKLTKVVKEEREQRASHAIVKIILKIVGGIILVLIFGGLYACARCLCRKKNQEVLSNADETVPALPPNANTTGTQQYPQQPGAYPLSQMPNPSAPYAYSPFQQNPLNPAVPYPTASYSTPPYPSAPYPTAPYPVVPYPTGPSSSPSAPTCQEKEANNQVLL